MMVNAETSRKYAGVLLAAFFWNLCTVILTGWAWVSDRASLSRIEP